MTAPDPCSADPDLSLTPGTSAWVLTDGKIGDEVHCFGIADALGLAPQRKLIAPRALWAALAPFGPIDPRDRPSRPDSPIAPPFPDIAIASGRRLVPYLKRVKQASGGRTFTVFLKDPRTGPRTADVIWVPEHDPLRGSNVLVSLLSPHRVTPPVLADARAHPDPRLRDLPRPRLGMILGGPSGHHEFGADDARQLGAIAAHWASQGFGVTVTPSRRTPDGVLKPVRAALAASGALGSQAFVWDRTGQNPYVPILAGADRIIVTGDSVNMVGEATATGAPVYVYVPSGTGHPKMTRFLDRMAESGAIRRYSGTLDPFTYPPTDPTPTIAAGIAARYRAFREQLTGAGSIAAG